MLTIKKNISLLPYNTFHVDAKAKYFVEIKNVEEISELLKSDIWKQNPFFILGGGANILFTKDFEGIVIKNEILGKEIVLDNAETVEIKIGAGENRHQFVLRCVDHNYGGIENLPLIPGTVGASPIGNIGAYGVEVKDLIKSVEGINLDTGKLQILTNSDCKFAYRESIFKNALKGKFLVTHVVFALKKINENYKLNLNYKDIQNYLMQHNLGSESLSAKDLCEIIISIRQSRLPDPSKIGTVGSFFKNPIIPKKQFDALKTLHPELIGHETAPSLVKLPAGQLIELSGLKGYQQGNVSISGQHALVLLHNGKGTGSEIVTLANHIISEVKKNFGITLDPEVIYV